jgi:hypothetical protein
LKENFYHGGSFFELKRWVIILCTHGRWCYKTQSI